MNLHDRPLIEQMAVSYATEIERLNDEIARLRAANDELVQTLQQPDQVGYWQRRSELAEEKLARLRTGNTAMDKELDATANCHDLALKANARLRAALEAVQYWNDQELDYSEWAGVMEKVRKAIANEHKS